MKDLVCEKCNEIVEKTGKLFNVKSEFNFTVPVFEYKCKKCGKTYIVCPDCEGRGFINTFKEFTCSTCNGSGIIEKSKFTF